MTITTTLHDRLRLDGKTAVVTGGGRGLGAAIAEQLVAAGARVALVGRNEQTLETTAERLGAETVVIPADLADPEAPSSILDRALHAFGRLDIFVNNAGIGDAGPSDEFVPTQLDDIWAVNVRASLLLAGRAARHIAESGGGSIVIVSSALSRVGTPQLSLYSATKGALDSAGLALAAEWGGRGVRVNVIRPGVIDTDMSVYYHENPEELEAYEASLPLARMGKPHEVGDLVTFLSSPAAAYITGQLIDIDGGWAATRPRT